MSRTWRMGEVFVLRHAGFPFDWLEELGFSEELERAADRVLDASSDAERMAAREAYEALYARERGELREALRKRSADAKLQEAVFLSSPAMYENVWRRYVQAASWPDNSDNRRVDRQAYTYLQRFCGKNETTSFFGPIAYGSVVEDDSFAMRVVPSEKSGRRTLFAFWAVLELARAVGRDPAFRHALPLRKNPIFQFSDTEARCEALQSVITLGDDASKLLRVHADGESFTQLAVRAGTTPQLAERALIPLLKGAAILRGLSFESETFATFESLRASVSALPHSDAWIAKLDGLQALLQQFQDAELEDRRVLLPKLEAAFTELTGKPARRGEGQIYSDRLVLYEEAASPFAVELGHSFGTELGQRLSRALEFSAAYGEKVQAGYQEQVAAALGPVNGSVDFLTYVTRLRPESVSGSRFSPVPPIVLDENRGQATLRFLDFPGSQRTEDHPSGRYALPDVCISGPRADGKHAPGEYEVLLARVHHHLLLWSWLSAFHHDRAKYERSARRWIENEPSAKGLVALTVRRRNKGFYAFPGTRLAYSATEAGDVDARALGPWDVRVEVVDGKPRLVNRNGEPLTLYLTLDDFSSYPPFAALAHPQVLHAPLRPKGDHLPRIQIGDALYQRARWEKASEIFGKKSGGPDVLLAARKLQRSEGWPRFVFVRTDVERKPYLIDLRSPFALDLLKHLTQKAAKLTVVEMYPPPEGLWLQDERGRYTCELRMQAERWSAEKA